MFSICSETNSNINRIVDIAIPIFLNRNSFVSDSESWFSAIQLRAGVVHKMSTCSHLTWSYARNIVRTAIITEPEPVIILSSLPRNIRQLNQSHFTSILSHVLSSAFMIEIMVVSSTGTAQSISSLKWKQLNHDRVLTYVAESNPGPFLRLSGTCSRRWLWNGNLFDGIFKVSIDTMNITNMTTQIAIVWNQQIKPFDQKQWKFKMLRRLKRFSFHVTIGPMCSGSKNEKWQHNLISSGSNIQLGADIRCAEYITISTWQQ